MQGFVSPFSALQADGSALTASTTATSLLNAQSKYTMGAGFVDVIGKQFLVLAHGRITTVTTPGTLTMDLRLGAVIVANGGALVLSSTAKTNVSWFLSWMLTCRAIGAGGSATANFMHQGVMTSEALGATTVAGEAKSMCLPVSAPAVGTSFDPAAAEQWDMFATWGTNNANSIQCHGFQILSLN